MVRLTLPVYYELTKGKKTLVGVNAYRNWHYHTKNKVKQHYHSLVHKHLENFEHIKAPYQITYEYHYKNKSSDMMNVVAQIDKFLADALIEHNIVDNDTVQHYTRCVAVVGVHDKHFPRLEIKIEERA